MEKFFSADPPADSWAYAQSKASYLKTKQLKI